MLNKEQNQDVGAGGVAIQAGGNVFVGLSVSDARAIALDVSRATYYELSGAARDTMSGRVEEITEKVISKLNREFPEGLQKARDPDFQHALHVVQKQYGRTGDDELGDLLVDILVDRSKQDKRDILQIVLNECLEVAPKLTSAHFSILAIIFLFSYTQHRGVINDLQLGDYFDSYVLPFTSELAKNRASFQHLQFTGCGSAGDAISLEQLLLDDFQGLFSNGFDLSELDSRCVPVQCRPSMVMRCLNNESRFQIGALNKMTLEKLLDEAQLSEADRFSVAQLFNVGKMSYRDVREKCLRVRPYMEKVFDCWSESEMSSFKLTSVGMAIGHANLKRLTGGLGNLSDWVN